MTAPRRPRSPDGVRVDPNPVRSYRMPEDTYQALRAKAAAEDPPRTVTDVTLALLDAYLDGEIQITYLGDVVQVSE